MADKFRSAMRGKLSVTAQLASQLKPVATDIAAARIRKGNISPTMTHRMTPQETAKKKTKVWAATRATVPWVSGMEMLSPEPVLQEKAQDARARDTDMPAEPIRARGLRPTRSMNSIATTVPTMLTIEVERLISREPDGNFLWHMGFQSVPDMPEFLIAGKERAYLRWFFEHFAFDPAAITESDLDEYAAAITQVGALRAGLAV